MILMLVRFLNNCWLTPSELEMSSNITLSKKYHTDNEDNDNHNNVTLSLGCCVGYDWYDIERA